VGLLDLFTGDASAKAAKNNMYAIATGQQQGGNALMTTGQNALQYLFGNGASQPGALQLTQRGYDQAQGALGSQYGQTQDLLTQLGQLYAPETQMGQSALTKYLNATGANGAAGSAQAQADFTASPGYQFGLNQALGAVQRSAASRGGLAGGNATAGILNTATGLSNQEFQQYINASNLYGQGIAGQAGALQGRAQASSNYGSSLAGLATGEGSALSGIYGQGANVQTSLGQGIAGLANSTTNALVQNNNNLAQSENAAGANILSGLLGAVRGGGNLFSGIGSGLRSLFS
jgi:hypothetical protein